jgi:hypothetical protein
MALLFVVPVLALAQRGGGMGRGGGGGGGGGRGGGRGGPSYDDLSAKDIGKFDPIKLMLDNHKDLKLDIAETATLKQFDSTAQLDNKRLFNRIDSLQKSIAKNASNAGNRGGRGGGGGGGGGYGRRGGGGGSDTSADGASRPRTRGSSERQTIANTLTELRRAKDSLSLRALGILTEAQRPKANELLKKRDDELAKIVKGAGFTMPAPAPLDSAPAKIPPPMQTAESR